MGSSPAGGTKYLHSMDKALLFAILGGLGAMLGWGATDFFAKKTIDRIGDVVALFWMQLLGIFPLFLVLIFKTGVGDITFESLYPVVFLALIDALGYIFFFKALKKGKVSIIGPIVSSYASFSVLVSAFVFGEKVSGETVLFLSLIFLGILLTSLDIKQLRSDISGRADLLGGIPQALIAVALFAVWFPFWDNLASISANWLTSLLILRIFISLFVYLFATSKSISLKISEARWWRLLILMALLDVGAYFALTWGYSTSTRTSIVSVLSAAFSVPTLILARLFLKEKLKFTQGVGVIIIIGSLVLMAGL